jgi:hypothetical protein
VVIIDTNTQDVVSKIDNNQFVDITMKFSPNGKHLITESTEDGTLNMIDTSQLI